MVTSRSRSDANRTPVASDGHPLTLNSSPDSDSSGVDHPGVRTGTTPRRSPPVSESVNLNEQFEETIPITVDEELENDSCDNRDSDVDAELGRDDDTSSNWESDYGQPPAVSSLILLGGLTCRVPTQVTAKDGSKVSCVCGKPSFGCKRHAGKVGNGAYRGSEGYYVSMNEPARGFKGHGRLAFFYTREQYHELRLRENSEMATLLSAQNDAYSDGDDETLDLAREARVSFGDSVQVLGVSPNDDPYVRHTATAVDVEATRLNLQARTGGRTKQRKGTQQPQPATASLESRFYGLEDASNRRWVFHEFDKVRECLDEHDFKLKEVFLTSTEASKWKNREGEVEDDSDLLSSMFGSSNNNKKKQAARQRPTGPAHGDPSSSSSDPDSSSADNSSVSTPKKRSKKKRSPKDKRQEKHTRHSRRHRNSSGPSSSDDSSSSEESSSDSSESIQRSRKKKTKSKKKGRRGKRKKTRAKRSQFSGADPSVGSKKHIHGMTITGGELDKEMGPDDLRKKDMAELYGAAADIAAIPGMLGTNRSLDEDARNTTEMAATLIATAVGHRQRGAIHDSMWQGSRRNALDQIRDREGLFKFVKAVDKDKDAVFEKQDQALQTLLFHRHYSETSVDEYIRNGLLPRIVRDSFRCYSNLLSTIRQLAFDHGTHWEGGPAKAMLEYHSSKLLQVRRHALTRRMLVLRTYVYLRDAESKAYYHESMTEDLWARMALLNDKLLSMPISEHEGGEPSPKLKEKPDRQPSKEGNPKCSHCRSSTVHKKLSLDPTKKVCPFLTLPQVDARKAAGIANANHKDNGGDFKECCKAALESLG
jgi:hypothetical protein